MTTTDPRAAAIEAAARACYEFEGQNQPATWESRAEWLKDAYRQEAAASLAAAVPHLTRDLRALHRVREVKAITGTDCVREDCDHEDECPTQPVETCAHCWDIAERANMYFAEAGIPEEVLWPCRTKEALDALERGGEQ